MINTFFKSIGFAIVAFLLPIVPLLLIIGFAILVDTIFGIIASKKNKEPILSNKLARILTKSVIYMSLTLLAYGVDLIFLNQIFMNKFSIHLLFTKIIALGIVIVETFSIDEKIRKFNNDKGMWYYFKLILAKGKSITASLKDIKSDIKDLKKEDK